MIRTLTTTLSALAVGAVAATGTVLLVQDDEPADTAVLSVAEADDPTESPDDQGDAEDGAEEGTDDEASPDCGPWRGLPGGFPGGFPGGWGDGELPDWVEDRIDEALGELPAELRQDIEDARDIQVDEQRRQAFEDIRNRALAGDYGAEVQEQAEQLQEAFGDWKEWRGDRPGGPWGGHDG